MEFTEDQEEAVMYRHAEIGSLDRKEINDALDKHLEKHSPSSSQKINDKEKERLSAPSTSSGKRYDHPVGLTQNKCSDEEPASEEYDVSGSDEDETSWIEWFCSLKGNEFLCEVDEKYIKNKVNLCGLRSEVPYYDYSLDLILDVESSHDNMLTVEQPELIDSGAEMLYGLIHARYILTGDGMAKMLEKYKYYDFGRCPRVYCYGHPCLPVGKSYRAQSGNVKIFCPKCENVYHPRIKSQGNIDGAYFGTAFPYLFLSTYPHLKPSLGYTPSVFGFEAHET